MRVVAEHGHASAKTGGLPVKAECLPFSEVPHSTRLFIDFLDYTSTVQQFYPRSPYFSEWFKNETPRQRYDDERRGRVAAILEGQNRRFGSSSKTLDNIARFRAGASAVVTGQQVGLFGGPLFAIFKALTAVKLANEASDAGVPAVPMFWLATEDHDLAEVNNTAMLTAEGRVEALVSSASGVADAPVGAITFGQDIGALVEAASSLLGSPEVANWLRQSYRSNESFGTAFGRLFAKVLADWGVIILDGADPELDEIARPIYRAAIERAAEIDDALLKRGKELEAHGYHQQVKVTPSSTLLFTIQNGARTVVHRVVNGDSSIDFLIKNEKVSGNSLLQRISDHPEEFSPNVLLRPVVQDYLLPTLAYTGGSAEVAYFAQAAVVYEAVLGHVTPILPRFSATLVDAKAQRLLEKYSLAATDVFRGAEALKQEIAARTLPPDLQQAFDAATASVVDHLGSIRTALMQLDPTLIDASDRAASKIQYQLEHLRASAARAELRQSELLQRHADFLSNLLFPNKTLQEREIAGMYFLGRYGMELLPAIYESIHTDCLDHQVLSVAN